MASEPWESRWLFGLHDPGGEQIMLAAGKPGWVVFTEAIGRNPTDHTGRDFRPYSGRQLGVICRINHGYYPQGTLPWSQDYGAFAQRCANFVAASPGCGIWIIGNEPNYQVEWPTAAGVVPSAAVQPGSSSWWARLVAWWRRGLAPQSGSAAAADEDGVVTVPGWTPPADDPWLRGLGRRGSRLGAMGSPDDVAAQQDGAESSGSPLRAEVITPARYVECYRRCRDAIHRLRGHEQDKVLVAGPTPWNNQTQYPGNERGDWVKYLADVLAMLGPEQCDGIALHTYSHGADLNTITSEARMNPPFSDRRFHFRAYQDFMQAIPLSMRDVPVYITETDQVDPWVDARTGWVEAAYQEIDAWNRRPGAQKIRALVLYRWPRYDRWYIDGKQGVIADFRAALRHEYRWDRYQPQPAGFRAGTRLKVETYLNLRRTPGYLGKPPEDRVAELEPGRVVVVTDDGVVHADGLVWWRVQVEGSAPPVVGWIAQFGPDGAALVSEAAPTTQPPPEPTPPTPGPPVPTPTPRLRSGQQVRTTTIVNARRSPGYVNKPAGDIVREVAQGTLLRLTDGPQVVDGLVWWLAVEVSGAPIAATWAGWVAEDAPNGAALLEDAAGVTPPPPPVRFRPGERAMTVAFVRLRRTPGYVNKPENDVVADIWQGTAVVILSGPRTVDELTWWEVETQDITGKPVRGWMAEKAPGGIALLEEWRAEDRTPFKIGDLAVVGATAVRARRTPGYLDKPDDDVLGEFRPKTTLYWVGGPQEADGLTWWRGSGISSTGRVVGWVAQGAPNGATLVGRAPKLPGTEIPNVQQAIFLGTPFSAPYVITQLWGENPGFYGRYSYDGVALLGHNGVDFGTPLGATILATDGGEVTVVGFEPSGFGNYVMLAHGWGQSVYAHLSSVSVQVGQKIARGNALGAAGSTGNSSGPHLHFAIRIHPFTRTDGWGGYSDPLPYLNPRGLVWPQYMMDSGPGPARAVAGAEGGSAQWTAAPPGMAEDAPGYIRP